MKVDLFYLSPNTFGGWVTYTAHLMDALSAVGIEVELFKIGNRTERQTREFGYGEVYQNLSLADALARQNPKLIVAGAKRFREVCQMLYDTGAWLVVHDPTELKNLPGLNGGERCIVVRKVGLEHLPKAVWIRHPYKPRGLPSMGKTQLAVSVSRIDFDKHTEILLDANRLLEDPEKISIHGFENRIFTRFNIVPHYPEWVQSVSHYPRGKDEAFKILQHAYFSVDMSQIKGDGGGTQYTFLESWDAGAVPVINSTWERSNDDMVPGRNCLVAGNGEDLARLLKHMDTRLKGDRAYWEGLMNEGRAQLTKNHLPATIGLKYKELLFT